MTSKTNPVEGGGAAAHGPARLHHLAIVEVAGADAAAFLQRQCMNDVKRLDHDGAMQWSGLLSAKGRVLFLFRLLRVADDRYLLIAPAADAAALAGELQRYVLRSKLRLRRDGWQASGLIAAAPAPGKALAWDTGRWIGLHEGAEAPGVNAALERAWRDLDLRRGIPHIEPALADRYTPQMLGLGRLQAFSLTKGCYPGQEIVARTHYLGQQKREWTPLRAPRPLALDEAVFAGGREVGRVLQIAPGDPALGASVVPGDAGEALCLGDGSLLVAERESAG